MFRAVAGSRRVSPLRGRLSTTIPVGEVKSNSLNHATETGEEELTDGGRIRRESLERSWPTLRRCDRGVGKPTRERIGPLSAVTWLRHFHLRPTIKTMFGCLLG